MYFRVQQEQWQNVKHFNITADPGTHNGKSVFAALAYTWETNMGTVGAWQHIVSGKKILPDESQHYRYILSLKKRARVASLRQLQAASHVLSQLSKGQLTIGEFNVPGLCLRPVQEGEVRLMIPTSGTRAKEVLVRKDTREMTQVLPDDLEYAPLVTLSLDRGSIGAAGGFFCMTALNELIWIHFDKIHQMVRNVRNASKHALRGKYLKVQLFSAFIYGINYKPFGTGHFGDAKARMLDCFLETEDTDSAIFEKHWVRIAGNFGMRAETEQDKENVLARVADMASFRKRLQPPKLGRWCAWNGCAQEQMVEFCAARMVYEHHLNCEDDGAPTRFHSLLAAGRQCSPQAELAALKRADGGFKLAYKLMSDELEIRLLFAFYARDRWDPNSIAGQMQLKGLLMKLADNKAVEDLHKALREKGAANRNRRLTSGMIQDILVHSRVLENRDIDHPNMVSEDYFKANFLRTKMSPLVWRHKSAKHLMPAKVDQILLWPTRKSSARSSSGAMRRISSSSSRLPAAS